ncbi:MAG: hypothetical protein U1E76_16000 [Planctomycetota bacterium]
MVTGPPTIRELDPPDRADIRDHADLRHRRQVPGRNRLRVLAALASSAVLAGIFLAAPVPRHPQGGSVKLFVKIFPTLATYPCETVQYRVDSPEVKDPDQRGEGWIRIANLSPGRHFGALVDHGRILALRDFVIGPGTETEATAVHVPREALDLKVRPRGRVVTLENGVWRGVPNACVILIFPSLSVLTDADGHFESDTEIEIARLFSITVGAPGYRAHSLNIEHLKIEMLEYYQRTGEVLVPIVRKGSRDLDDRR